MQIEIVIEKSFFKFTDVQKKILELIIGKYLVLIYDLRILLLTVHKNWIGKIFSFAQKSFKLYIIYKTCCFHKIILKSYLYI